MATKQEKEMAKIIDERVGTNLGQVHGTKVEKGKADVTFTVDSVLVARALIEAGYVKAESVIEHINKSKNLLRINISNEDFIIISDKELARILAVCMDEEE